MTSAAGIYVYGSYEDVVALVEAIAEGPAEPNHMGHPVYPVEGAQVVVSWNPEDGCTDLDVYRFPDADHATRALYGYLAEGSGFALELVAQDSFETLDKRTAFAWARGG